MQFAPVYIRKLPSFLTIYILNRSATRISSMCLRALSRCPGRNTAALHAWPRTLSTPNLSMYLSVTSFCFDLSPSMMSIILNGLLSRSHGDTSLYVEPSNLITLLFASLEKPTYHFSFSNFRTNTLGIASLFFLIFPVLTGGMISSHHHTDRIPPAHPDPACYAVRVVRPVKPATVCAEMTLRWGQRPCSLFLKQPPLRRSPGHIVALRTDHGPRCLRSVRPHAQSDDYRDRWST